MSLKDYFLKNTTIINQASAQDIEQEVDSKGYLEQFKKDKNEFVPLVDFEDPANFIFFGSARKQYLSTISRIYNTYPYDGSRTEKLKWQNESSYFDKWFLTNKYPKTTGYAIISANGWGSKVGSTVSGYGEPLSKEYIQFKGGPNTASMGMAGIPISDTFAYSNIYDPDTNRVSNLELETTGGVTVEFWLKKDSFNTSNTQKEVVFDLWNSQLSSSTSYGRLTVELSGNTSSPFYVTLQSGSAGFYNQQIGLLVTTSSLSTWHHYALSFVNNSTSGIDVKFYVDGNLNTSTTLGTSINEVAGALIANVGALRTAPSGVLGVSEGWGKLSGSLDEFRYWKVKRTSQDIGRNWWSTINGGSNTDDYNTDIGVYYKFNEGITTNNSRDAVVLDYSGRVSNGYWTGYTSNSRNTSSAINEYGTNYTELAEPIIYSTHPSVSNAIEEYTQSGSYYDYNNPSSVYNSLPQWILDEDAENGEQLLELISIMSSYLDKLYLQIKAVPSLKNQYDFISGSSAKPLPYSRELLNSTGLTSPDLFLDATVFESILSRTNTEQFEENLYNIKNLIYQNIYSNLVNLYKSKGTEKAYKNLLHCFGIDESLVKINLYTSNVTFEFKDNFETRAIKKRMLDFNNPDRNVSTVYQFKDSTNSNSTSYLTGNLESIYVPVTIEAEAYFPVRQLDFDDSYNSLFINSSIFGMHTAKVDADDLTWASTDYANFQVKSHKFSLDSKDAYFSISSSAPFPIPYLTSSLFTDVYDNTKWNFAVAIQHNKNNLSNFVSGSTDVGYTLTFSGYNLMGDTTINEFSVSASIDKTTATNFLSSNKRLYGGAERTNFSGSVVTQSDIRLSDLKYWNLYLDETEILAHSRDLENYGTLNPLKNTLAFNLSASNFALPESKALLLHLNFENITGSDSNGRFTVVDASSGSVGNPYRYPTWLSSLTDKHYTARGDYFTTSDTTVIDTNYIVSAVQKLPESINSSDMINILTQDDDIFTRESRPVKFQINFEKSMYQTISSEMLKMFATVTEFNNLVGKPVNKYRSEYKDIKYLKQLFFEKVGNEPDLDKYLDFYKWFDSALGSFLIQFTPASADTSNGLLNVIESHVLERNKYQHKFPSLEFKQRDLEAGAETINRHLYNWRTGYRPLSNDESDNCFYWNQRAERDVAPLSSSNGGTNATRKQILNVSLQVLNRSFTTPYHFKLDESKPIQGGVNFNNNKNLEFATIALAPHGPMDADSVINVPANYLFAGITNTSSLLQDCNDVLDPNKKVKYHFTTIHGRDYLSSSLSYGEVLSSKIALPANFISGAVNTGYQSQVASEFMNGVVITNIHNDTYGSRNEVPIQGPFTNQWVGGRQSRHVPLNQGTDTYTNRPEAWKILMGTGSFSGSYQTAIGFVGADYPYPEGNEDEPSYPVRAHLRATYLRDETAKRSVNIRNIQSSTSSLALGNYRHGYEVVHSVGSTANNRMLVDAINPTINTELYGILRTDVTDGRVDYELPTRARSETIIVGRFSSPGDYRTMSRGYLTRYSEETSPYNALPFRNRQIIGDGRRNAESITVDTAQYPQIVSGSSKDLNTLLTIPSILGGYQSGSTTIPSLHKTQRNTVWVATSSINYDNGFITHQIPQKDTGYAWITASIGASVTSGEPAYYGHVFSRFTVPSASTSEYIATTFISSSDLVSYFNGSKRVFPADIQQPSVSSLEPIYVDFVGLNTNIYESSSYTNAGTDTNTIDQYIGGLVQQVITANNQQSGIFNALLLHRNGPYGYPVFKQIRTGEHRVARNLREDNYISVDRGFQLSARRYTGRFRVFVPITINEFGTELGIQLFKEPSVELNSLPLIIKIKDIQTPDKPTYITLKISYENLIKNFSNDDLNSILNLPKFKNEVTVYDTLLSLQNLDNTRYVIEQIEYETVVFPSPRNATLESNRERTNFSFNWRDTRSNRTRTNVTNIF